MGLVELPGVLVCSLTIDRLVPLFALLYAVGLKVQPFFKFLGACIVIAI